MEPDEKFAYSAIAEVKCETYCIQLRDMNKIPLKIRSEMQSVAKMRSELLI